MFGFKENKGENRRTHGVVSGGGEGEGDGEEGDEESGLELQDEQCWRFEMKSEASRGVYRFNIFKKN